MADSVLDLLLRVKKAGSGGKDTGKELNDLGKSVKKVRQEFKDMKAVGAAFNAGMSIVNAGLKAVSDSAEHLGRTELKTAFAAAAEAGQDLQDTLVTLKIGGRDAISWVTDAANGLKNLADLVNIGGIAFAQMTGAMSDSEAAARASALVYEDVKLTTEQLAQAQIDLKDPLDESARANREYKTAAENAATASQLAAQKAFDYQVATEKLIGPVSDLQFAMGEVTKATIFNAAAQNLDAAAALKLAVQMGLADEKALGVKDALDKAREAADTNKDGFIDAAEAANGYADAVLRISNVLQDAAMKQAQLNALANAMPGGPGGGVVAGGGQGAGGSGFAAGGPVSAGVPILVGELGPEIFTPPTNGTIIPNHEINNHMGGVNIYISGSGDPAAVAREVKRQLGDMGRSADSRRRT